MKVAIIGACGYIGSLFYNKLHKRNDIELYCYDIVDHDVFPPHSKKRASEIPLEEIASFNVILFLAGMASKADCEKEDYSEVYRSNVVEIEEFVKKTNSNQLIVYASTGSIYSNMKDEANETDTIDTTHLENYELSMYQREIKLNRLNKKTIGLRFGTVIGVDKNIRPEIIYNGLYYSAFSLNTVKVWNSNTWRSILFFEDLYNVFNILIANKDSLNYPDIYNIGSFNSTIYDIAKFISSNTDSQLVNSGASLQVGFQMNTTKFCERFNYKMIGTYESIHKYYIERKELLLELINNPLNKTSRCIACYSRLISHVLDLGDQPLANYFLDIEKEIETYPLHLVRCRQCSHTQINYIVDRNILFRNYIYESGTSSTLRKYFKDLAELYNSKIISSSKRKVLEIACNDGFQLDEFKELGWETYGVDPAENLVKISQKKGHTIDCKFWGKESISFLKDNKFDLIVAENVLAHVTNPINFLQHCEKIMDTNTLLVIQTSQANMYRNNEFDTIYHEHISFFTIKSMCKVVKNIGCTVVNVYKPSIHGVSYVFEIKKGIQDVTLPMLEEEEQIGLYTYNLYNTYEKAIQKIKINSLNILNKYANKGFNILGFGAAAKGNVFLNYIFDSKHNVLCPEFIIDDSELKQGMYTPGTLIPVTNINILNRYINKKILIIVLAWNFYEEINTKIKNYIKTNELLIDINYIRFFPDIMIC